LGCPEAEPGTRSWCRGFIGRGQGKIRRRRNRGEERGEGGQGKKKMTLKSFDEVASVGGGCWRLWEEHTEAFCGYPTPAQIRDRFHKSETETLPKSVTKNA
jgi:hypothetical protein